MVEGLLKTFRGGYLAREDTTNRAGEPGKQSRDRLPGTSEMGVLMILESFHCRNLADCESPERMWLDRNLQKKKNLASRGGVRRGNPEIR